MNRPARKSIEKLSLGELRRYVCDLEKYCDSLQESYKLLKQRYADLRKAKTIVKEVRVPVKSDAERIAEVVKELINNHYI